MGTSNGIVSQIEVTEQGKLEEDTDVSRMTHVLLELGKSIGLMILSLGLIKLF